MEPKVNGSYAKFAESLRELVIDAASQAIKPLQNDIDKRFAKIDSRFAQIDSRFAKIDSRFAQIDSRFAQIDSRFAEQRQSL